MSAITMSCSLGGGGKLPNAVNAPLLQTPPLVTGSGQEAAELSADTSDTWGLAGLPATVIAREYRLFVNGTVVSEPQPGPTFILPAGTGGQTYSYQSRVMVAGASEAFSAWVELDNGSVQYAVPQAMGTMENISVVASSPAQIIDLEPYFSGTDLTFTVQSGALPASSTLVGSVLTLTTDEISGPNTIVIRATNPGGSVDQEFLLSITAGATAPDAFQPVDWAVTAAPVSGAIDIEVFALPSDAGSSITAVEYRSDDGPFTAIGSSTGTYRITGLNLGQPHLVTLRAVSALGAGPASDTKTVTPANVPAAFTADQWSLADPRTGDDIQIAINALPSAEGAPLTRLQYNIDDTGWADFSTAPAVGTFDILDLFTVDVASGIVIRASNSIGDAALSDVKFVTPTSEFEITGTVENQIEINGVAGTFTITITDPTAYAAYDAGDGPGVFVADGSELIAGPITLVPPQIADGSIPLPGTTLTVIPGLWIYDADSAAPTINYRWLRNGTVIPGENSTTYIIQAADAGQQITVEETVTDANGTRVATSVSAQGAAAINAITATTAGIHVDYTGVSTLTGDPSGTRLEIL